jgi:hypothetical protein
MRSFFTACAIATLSFGISIPVSGMITLDFGGITENDTTGGNKSTGESQLQVDILDGGGIFRVVNHTVSFVIKNIGTNQSTVTDIFFMDQRGLLESILLIDDSQPGVDYTHPSNQNNLPGGAAVGFFANDGFSAMPTPPPSQNGIDPGESVTIVFAFANIFLRDDDGDGEDEEHFTTFDSIIESLQDGSFQIGMRVQNFVDGGSESFLNIVPVPLPVPMFAGLAGLGLIGTRRSRRSL